MSTAAHYDLFINRQIRSIIHDPIALSSYGKNITRSAPDPFVITNRDPATNLNRNIIRLIDLYKALSKIPLGKQSPLRRIQSINLRKDISRAKSNLFTTLALMSSVNDRRNKSISAARTAYEQVSDYIEVGEYYLKDNPNVDLARAITNLKSWIEQYGKSIRLCESECDVMQMTIDAVQYFCTERLTIWESMLNVIETGNRQLAIAVEQERVMWAP